jgi:hypothetical protein
VRAFVLTIVGGGGPIELGLDGQALHGHEVDDDK